MAGTGVLPNIVWDDWKKVENLESKVDGMSHQLTRIETKMGNAAWAVGCVGIPILVALLGIAVSSLF